MTLTARAAAAGLPATVTIGRQRWPITYRRSVRYKGDEFAGLCYKSPRRILILWDDDVDKVRAALLHEMCHAAINAGITTREIEERVVLQIEKKLYGPLRDMGWLKGGTDG